MPEFDRLSGDSKRIYLEFAERERTPEQIIELCIRLHLASLPLSNTKQYIEKLSVGRSRIVIHNRVQKAGLQSTSDDAVNQIAVDERRERTPWLIHGWEFRFFAGSKWRE